ncbi:MAG TPA: hypothetical protein VJY41_04925 [Prolixibacteraceae bacterium]|nr:hypothetical protein [Prolixibacteraceae bacterium]
MSKKNKYNFSKKADKSNPFVVPEGYFDNFSERLMGRIELEVQEKKRPTFKIINLLRPALLIAASFAILFVMIYLPVKTFRPKTTADNNVNSSELFDFLGLYHINDLAIIEAFEEPAEEQYDQQFLENILMASITEYDLLHLNE